LLASYLPDSAQHCEENMRRFLRHLLPTGVLLLLGLSCMTSIAQNPPQPSSTDRPDTTATSGQGSTIGLQGDAAAGRLVFRKCQACHSLEPGKDLVGPSLAGILNRKAGTEAGFDYSPAVKQSNITWNPQTLDEYLADPAKVIPGNRMPFPGLKTPDDRKDVIAFLAAAGQPPQQASAPGPAAGAPAAQTQQPLGGPSVRYVPDARYTLRTGIADGRMVYIGVGGAIDGKVNPPLTATEGQVVQLTIINERVQSTT
jgi:nitrite reductase (NO-forming)